LAENLSAREMFQIRRCRKTWNMHFTFSIFPIKNWCWRHF